MKVKEVSVAWAAGIIDGEGCIHMHRHSKRSPYYSLLLKVSMCHEATILRLRDIFGEGSIQLRLPPDGKSWRPAWSWLCTTRQAERVLKAVRPHLVTRAEEADLALEYLALPVMPGTKRIPDDLAAKRLRIFEALRDIKVVEVSR